MKANPNSRCFSRLSNLRVELIGLKTCIVSLCILALLVLSGSSALSQGTTVTSNPTTGATGVSPTADVVFTFSSAMDPQATQASFYSLNPPGGFPVTQNWNVDNTVLTCTPDLPFPDNANISWIVAGSDAGGAQVFGQGSFSTGAGTGGGGSGTNAITTFSAGKIYFFEQLSSGPATPVADFTYAFSASTSLASNRTASAISFTRPGSSSPISLNKNFARPEDWYFISWTNNQAQFESLFPQGDYAFNVTGTPANLQATVTCPTTMLQPNAPHVSNFDLLQNVDASQGFSINWDPFTNGTTSDFISVVIANDLGKTVFETPGPGTNGALTGTAKTVNVPAGKITAGTTNTTFITFYKWAATSNANYATVAFRATETQLSVLAAGSGVATRPVVGNTSWGPGGFGFDVGTSANQTLKILYSTDCSLPITQWQTLYTTNSPGTSIHVAVPPQLGASVFFRVQNGP